VKLGVCHGCSRFMIDNWMHCWVVDTVVGWRVEGGSIGIVDGSCLMVTIMCVVVVQMNRARIGGGTYVAGLGLGILATFSCYRHVSDGHNVVCLGCHFCLHT
jgi:hypothetical protein